ncbi:SulP family inorganic anion transporter [Pseudomonas protegens]|uniref:Sulfate transporter family protein n=1 Tax=Pseudomonas protegens (strain DSM 19095 / LMG 27888 / CFBP 6595 / CHA0) TaxID=1124983 RepID=A0A2C9EDV9_PSEPH|nr:SulP family inorganic anion transporter [Pseudomonas protegens]AGL81837.1 sulfate transporter family protein [Pseudomonas protegens CHA0]MBP5112425.1 SulP family inorganic anion transporter [Pseudomonas protegens]QTU26645.1 SulP family inorganic anion transporter [Pseudomonas protegens]QTU30280.1 SulP family inorganic anion transporter [Pseudomonas protegens]RLO22996.1 SulP family inorganic anion transporter [Pseudomonas protegens]
MAWPDRQSLLPLLSWLPRQTRASVGRDLLVGLSGAILALPQSIAYALIAGLPPEYGLYAAIVPVLIACLWGSSWHLICGPTAAISIVLYASVSPLAVPASEDYITLILLLTLLAGVFQWLLGMLRFGALVNFVSHSVVLGFTLGAAVVIALGQLPNLLGLELPNQATALNSLSQLLQHLGEVDRPSLLLGLGTLALGVAFKLLAPRWPGLLLSLVFSALVVWLLPGVFGHVQLVSAFAGRLPPFSPLPLDLELILRLLPSAVAVGMLGLVTSLSIARSLSARSEQLLDANQEVRAQGLSNMVGAFFSGYLSSGSFTRSGLSYEAGACSPLAGVFSALWVALFAVAGAGLIAHIPIPAMAGSILLICWGLVDHRGIRALFRVSRAEFVVMSLTCVATLLLELQTAIYAGVLASLFFYLKRTSQPRVQQSSEGDEDILRVGGSIFFGASHYLQVRMQRCHAPRLVIDARQINFIDYSGVEMLHQEARRLKRQDRSLILRRARQTVKEELIKLEGPERCPIHFED